MEGLATASRAALARGLLPLALALLVLTGCGQKGPLQLPGYGKDTPWPVRPKDPAAETAQGGTGTGPGNTNAQTSPGAAAGVAPDTDFEESSANAKNAAKPAGTGTAAQPVSGSPGDGAQDAR